MNLVLLTFLFNVFCNENDLKSKAQVYKDNIKELLKIGRVNLGDYAAMTRQLDEALTGLSEVLKETVASKNLSYAKELKRTIEIYQRVAKHHKSDYSNIKYYESIKNAENN